MNDQGDNQGLSGVFIGLGVLLIVLGALFFVGQAVGFDLGRFGWPFFVILTGLAVAGVGLAAGGGPSGERITPLGVSADAEPWWEPGTRIGHHAGTCGYVVGE